MDRSAALDQLAEHVTRDGMTLGEYSDRAAAVQRAATDEERDAALAGLTELGAQQPATSRRWLVGIFGGTDQRGRWRLARRLRIIALLGGAKLDLAQAEIEGPESVIAVFAFLGGVDLRAPNGIPIQLSGFSLLGGKSDTRPHGESLSGAPLVRVRVFSALGGVSVKSSGPTS